MERQVVKLPIAADGQHDVLQQFVRQDQRRDNAQNPASDKVRRFMVHDAQHGARQNGAEKPENMAKSKKLEPLALGDGFFRIEKHGEKHKRLKRQYGSRICGFTAAVRLP